MKTRNTWAIACTMAMMIASFAQAANLTWDANAATAGQTDGLGVWLNTDQWWAGTNNATWTDGNDAIFGNGGAGGAVSLASPATVNSLTFNYFTGTYTLGTAGQAITNNTGITMNAGAGAVKFVSPITLGAAQIWLNNTGNLLTVDDGVNSVINNNGFLLTFKGNGSSGTKFTIPRGNGITGSGGVTVDNAYLDLRMGGNNSVNNYTGTTTVQNGGGILHYANNIGSGNIILNGGILDGYFNNGLTRTVGTGVGQIQLTGGASGFGCNGNGTIALGNVTWGTVTFNPDALVLGTPGSSAGTTTFSGNINLGGTTRTVLVNSSVGAGAISGVISTSGTAGLTKTGVGNLVLSATDTYNGDTTINAGTLTLSGANGKLTATTALKLNSGTLQMINVTTETAVDRFPAVAITVNGGGGITWGNTSGNNIVYAETLGSVTHSSGQLNIVESTAQVGTGTSAQTLTLGGLSQSGSGSVTFSAASTGPQASGNKNMIVVTGGGTTDANKIMGPWATVGTTAALQTDYAVYNSSYVVGLGATPSTDDSAWTTTWADTSNYAWGNTTLGMTNTTTRNINTLRHTGGAETLTLSGANLGTYGILNGVASALTITRVGSSEVVTLPTTSAGSLYLNAGSGAININAPITDNTGNLTLVKNGSGTLTLKGVNTFTGNIAINAGTLQIGTAGSTSSLGGGNYAGNILNNGTLDIQSGVNHTLSGVISGSGNLFKKYNGTLTLTGANTFTGKTTLGAFINGVTPILVVSSFNSVVGGTASSSLGAPTTVANGTIEFGSNNSSPNPVLRYVGTGETTDRIINITFNSSARRTLDASGSGLLKFTSAFTGGNLATGGIDLLGNGDGELVQGLPFLMGPLYKSGTGTWTLGGLVGATGATTISGGILIVVTGGGAPNSAVTVNNTTGCTLGIKVADSTKQWSCSALTFAGANAKLALGFTAAPNASLAPLKVNGNLSFTGTPTVTVDPANLVSGQSYPLLVYGGTLTGTAPSSATIGHGLTGALAWGDGTTYSTKTLVLAVSGTSTLPLTWKASGSGTWDINTTANWNDNVPNAANYLEGLFSGDPVVFADTYVTADTTVTLNTTVKPASVTATNAAYNYTISGSGKISGATGLIKSGSGTLTLATTNTYTGTTVINGGAVIGQTGGSCDMSDVTVNSNGALGVRMTSTNQQWSCKSVTVSTSTGTSLKFSFALEPSMTLAPLKINGNLTFTGTPVVDVSRAHLVMGTKYPLLVVSGTAPTSVVPELTGVGGNLAWEENTLYLTPQAAGTVIQLK